MNRLILKAIILQAFSLAALICADIIHAETRCWNVSRGFESFSPEWTEYSSDSPGVIANNSSDTLLLLTPVDSPDRFDFIFKTKNRRCSPAKKYSYTDSQGKRQSVKLPPWGIAVRDRNGNKIEYMISVAETESDGISTSPALRMQRFENGLKAEEILFSNRESNIADKIKTSGAGPDYTGVTNAWRLNLENRILTLQGSLHSPLAVFSTSLPEGFIPVEIGFILTPASELEFSEMRLNETRMKTTASDSPWTDEENLRDYLKNSYDNIEGYWQLLDRSLEETLLKPGGDYRLAIVKAADGYDIIYLDGARINKNEWHRGMIKAHLSPTGIENIWDVSWTDSMFGVMDNEIKAALEQPGTISFQFPYQNSGFRLQKTGN